MRNNKSVVATSDSALAEANESMPLDSSLTSFRLEKTFWDALIIICGTEAEDQERYFTLSQRRHPNLTGDQALKLCIAEDLQYLAVVGERQNCTTPNYTLHDSATAEQTYHP